MPSNAHRQVADVVVITISIVDRARTGFRIAMDTGKSVQTNRNLDRKP